MCDWVATVVECCTDIRRDNAGSFVAIGRPAIKVFKAAGNASLAPVPGVLPGTLALVAVAAFGDDKRASVGVDWTVDRLLRAVDVLQLG